MRNMMKQSWLMMMKLRTLTLHQGMQKMRRQGRKRSQAAAKRARSATQTHHMQKQRLSLQARADAVSSRSAPCRLASNSSTRREVCVFLVSTCCALRCWGTSTNITQQSCSRGVHQSAACTISPCVATSGTLGHRFPLLYPAVTFPVLRHLSTQPSEAAVSPAPPLTGQPGPGSGQACAAPGVEAGGCISLHCKVCS